jgi:uncharacterized membrane protein YphA (DoxX/SURF4 family)
MSNTQPNWGLVFLRIVIGLMLILEAASRIQSGDLESLVLGSREAYAAAPDTVRKLGESVILPHPWFFSMLAVYGALIGGLLLFLGALTRPAGYLLALLFVNAALVSEGHMRLFALVMAAVCFAIGLSRAGLRSGADVFLDERLPIWMTWTRGGGGGGGASGD